MATHLWKGERRRQPQVALVAERHELSAAVDDVLDERIAHIRDALPDQRDMERES